MTQAKYVAVGAAEGLVLIGLVRWLGLWWALAAALLWFYYWRRNLPAEQQPLYAIGLGSLTVLLALNSHLNGQLLLVVGHASWRYYQAAGSDSPRFPILSAGWLQFISLAAIFTAEAVWHWPIIIVLILGYLTSITIALNFFAAGERAVRALAAAWGLIVAEASFVFSVWLVQYVMPKGILLIPQSAVVITALGYCFGSIYLAHNTSKLSRARLAEYAIIGLCLIVIVIAGTKWNGSI
jgi:hypothetical protein